MYRYCVPVDGHMISKCIMEFVGEGVTLAQSNIEATFVESRAEWCTLLNATVTCCCGATKIKFPLFLLIDGQKHVMIREAQMISYKYGNADNIKTRRLCHQTLGRVLSTSSNNSRRRRLYLSLRFQHCITETWEGLRNPCVARTSAPRIVTL